MILIITDKDGKTLAMIESDKLPIQIKYVGSNKSKVYHIKETKKEALILN